MLKVSVSDNNKNAASYLSDGLPSIAWFITVIMLNILFYDIFI